MVCTIHGEHSHFFIGLAQSIVPLCSLRELLGAPRLPTPAC